MEPAQVRYAWNGDVSLGYRLLGDGPVDLVYLHHLAVTEPRASDRRS